MPLNHDIVGEDSEPAERTWTESDVLLYALAVGAGQEDPLAELEFTTENSTGVQTRVPARFGSMEGRFTRPVLPCDELTISIWADGGTAYFRTTSEGATVIDRGRLTHTA